MMVQEDGPWATYIASDGRIGVASEDFHHDAILWVYGDFVDNEEELSYAVEIAKRLNAGKAVDHDQ